MGEKLDLRTAKFHIIGTSEPAPVVGSISERKDTLFIKQVSATEFEVFASDDKGKIVKLDKTMDKASFDVMILEYVKTHVVEFKNVLNTTLTKSFDVACNGIDVLLRHNSEKKVFSQELIKTLGKKEKGGEYIDYHYYNEDSIVIASEDYPENYVGLSTEYTDNGFANDYNADELGRPMHVGKTIIGKDRVETLNIDNKDRYMFHLIDEENIEVVEFNIAEISEEVIAYNDINPFFKRLETDEVRYYSVGDNVKFKFILKSGTPGRKFVIKTTDEEIIYQKDYAYNESDIVELSKSKIAGKSLRLITTY